VALSRKQMHHLARIGAERRLRELDQESMAIRAAFPEANASGRGRNSGAPGAARGRGFRMTAAQRRVVSERMKKYWAARRKAKG
jgi:hypothetical protein